MITRTIAMWWLCVLVAAGLGYADEVAHGEAVVLQNETLTVEIMVDDASMREHRGPRFDETARVRSVQRDGREYLHPFGLCDEFGLEGLGALGFDEADVGEAFIKVGVGLLERHDPRRYAFNRGYPLVEPFAVDTVEASADTVTVTQASPELRGYAYQLTKRYRIEGAKLYIAYALTNVGDRPFAFEQYNHNWFQFDEQPIGRHTYIEPAFTLPPLPFTWLVPEGEAWRFDRPIVPGDNRYWAVSGEIPREKAGVTVGDRQTGQRVHVSGDFAMSRFALYADADSVCPERFVRFDVEPDETVRWTRAYTFE
ncbi:hypothetical protein ACERK3_06485 [Phycisphaerales bacterium AB-hyl4]|uniref:Uncharacterized protein n=1 Tax=Natronomicrosphaera hydrolytica TaxID=3242702 RepID=A0ABV4U2X8_9BACT